MEAGVVIDRDEKPIFWHLPEDRTVGSIPDSRNLWDVLWENRRTVIGFAHSHPGSGVPSPSWEDITTFSAIELALGRQGLMHWWITSSDGFVIVHWVGPGKYDYRVEDIQGRSPNWVAPDWVEQLRKL